jgi:hypothetical protein
MGNAPAVERKRATEATRSVRSGSAKSPSAFGPASAAELRRRHFLGLQQTIGNQAVLRMLSPPAPVVQAKLIVNQPGDPYEQEADRISEQVKGMHESQALATPSISRLPAGVQRKCSCGASGEASCSCSNGLQKKPSASGETSPADAPGSVYAALKSPGQPLDQRTRSFMDSRLGHDFSQVRVHTGAEATASARAVNALAYTVGQDVVFAEGQYQPATAAGQSLLTHELVHTVQQGSAQRLQRRPTAKDHGPIDPDSPSAFLGKSWTDVAELGIIFEEEGARMYDAPGFRNPRTLKQNTKVFILRVDKRDEWYALTEVGAEADFGYIEKRFVWRYLPDPDSDVVRIRSGDTPIDIAATHYSGKGFDVHGRDTRYVVNALAWVNVNAKHNTKDTPGLEKTEGADAPWWETQARTNRFIWLPGVDYLNAIYEDVRKHGGGTGSITADLEYFFKDIYHAAAYGLSFLGGLVHGFLKSLYDAIAGIATLLYDVVKSIVTVSIVSDVKKLATAVSGLHWKDVKDQVGEWAEEWAEKLDSDSPWTAGHAHGYLTGYVMAEALMLLIGVGEIEAAKAALWSTRIGEAIKATGAYEKFTGLVAKAGETADKVGEAVAKTRQALENVPVAGKVVKVVAKGVTWTVEAVAAVLHLPPKLARSLAETIVEKAPKLVTRFIDRLNELSERALRWLFRCHSPCDFVPDVVEETLAKSANKDIEKLALEAEVAGSHAPPAHDPASPADPAPPVATDPNAPHGTVHDPAPPPEKGPRERREKGTLDPDEEAKLLAKQEELERKEVQKELRKQELEDENKRLSAEAKAADPDVKAAKQQVENLERKVGRLKNELVGKKSLTQEAVDRHPNRELKEQFEAAQKQRRQLRDAEKELEDARAQHKRLAEPQQKLHKKIQANQAELDKLNKPDLTPTARGRAVEKRALKEAGVNAKNTKPYTVYDPKERQWAVTIPDGITDVEQTVEVKDAANVAETQQIRLQREISRKKGKPAIIVTGDRTKVSASILEDVNGYKVIRVPYLGPQ